MGVENKSASIASFANLVGWGLILDAARRAAFSAPETIQWLGVGEAVLALIAFGFVIAADASQHRLK